VDTSYNPNMPELQVVPNLEKAAHAGIPVTTISNSIAASVGGVKLLPNRYTDASGHRSDIQLRLAPDENRTAVDIANIRVRNMYGEVIPLKDVVDIKPGST